MRSFKDNAGHVWVVDINVSVLKRVRAMCGVNLNAIVEVGADGKVNAKPMERLASDPILLVDVLYAVCKKDCDALGVSAEDFGCAMAGDAIESATDALLDGIVDFFPGMKRTAHRRILDASRSFREKARAKLMETVSVMNLEKAMDSALERLTGSSTNAPESAASTPEGSRSGNSSGCATPNAEATGTERLA